jgi:cytochrome P450
MWYTQVTTYPLVQPSFQMYGKLATFILPSLMCLIANVKSRMISRDVRSGIPPEKFSPERFMPGEVAETAIDPLDYVFGFGRRICPGKHLAMNNLLLICSALLKVFDFEPVRDENGRELPPELTNSPGLVRFVSTN